MNYFSFFLPIYRETNRSRGFWIEREREGGKANYVKMKCSVLTLNTKRIINPQLLLSDELIRARQLKLRTNETNFLATKASICREIYKFFNSYSLQGINNKADLLIV